MEIAVLSSGSSGNSFYVQNNKSGILIDAGISAKQIFSRLNILGIGAERVKGIFITHEHSDHIGGVDVFARNFSTPIFATKKTAENCFLCSQDSLINFIDNDSILEIAGMHIEAFSKSHRAEDPVSYSISKGKKISIITDAGYACENVKDRVSEANFLCLEANHDIDMLEQGPYPFFLKRWIKSDLGHLSNRQAALCVLEHGKRKLKNVILSHISRNNNTPFVALKTFNSLIKERYDLKPLVLAPKHGEMTGLFKI